MRVLRVSIAAVIVAAAVSAVALAQSNPFQPLAEAKWGPAPPMLPAGAQIAVLYGDPTKAAPYAVRLQFPAPPMLPAGAQIAVLYGDPTKAAPYAVRLQFPANYAIPAHSHPTDENVVVTSGSVYFGMGDKLDKAAGKPLGVNGFISAPANMNHYAFTKVASTIVLFGMGPVEFKYVNPNDDPRHKK